MSDSSLIAKPINFGRRIIFRFEKLLYRMNVLHAKNMSMPDFLCAGVEKAGTTWLYENLRCHHQLFLPDRKELNYFNNNYRFYGFPLTYYASYFEGSDKTKGEVTPCENLPIERIKFLHKVMPQLKVILILRNPVERAWSAILMHLLSAQKKRFDDLKEPDYMNLLNNSDILSKGEYQTILTNWRSVFSAEQLHISFYDNLQANPELFLKDIFKFLNIEQNVDWNEFPVKDVIHKSSNFQIPERIKNYLTDQYKDSISFIQMEYPTYGKVWK